MPQATDSASPSLGSLVWFFAQRSSCQDASPALPVTDRLAANPPHNIAPPIVQSSTILFRLWSVASQSLLGGAHEDRPESCGSRFHDVQVAESLCACPHLVRGWICKPDYVFSLQSWICRITARKSTRISFSTNSNYCAKGSGLHAEVGRQQYREKPLPAEQIP